MKNLDSLAEKGPLTDFKTRLKAQSHTPSELFLAVRTALLWKQAEKARLLFEAGVGPLKENEEKDQLPTHAASKKNKPVLRMFPPGT
ncbi:MAG: hypothetical protein HN366_21365 [Deltaproteobacteria bacterium]|jgi:hypothetical protein|nr:hypothetical protein [Deltaproteobacteria bacterium]